MTIVLSMKYIEKLFFILFPIALLKGTPWENTWDNQERKEFSVIARVFFSITFVGYILHMAVTVAQAKKNWIVMCATEDLVPFYEKIGFKKTGLSYIHTGLNNTHHQVLLANFMDGMAGRTVGPIYWNIVWSKSVEYLSQFDTIEVDPFMQVRLTIYKWFAPLAS